MTHLYRPLYCCAVLLLSSSLKSAEKDYRVTVQPSSLSSAPGAIKGHLHPEQIPDMTAYRLIFRAFSESPNPTSEEKLRQQVKLAAIGLDRTDADILSEILGEYNTQHAAYVSQYEGVIKSSTGGMVRIDHPKFTAQRDAIVLNTRHQVEQRLSPGGVVKLNAFVQQEKRGMTIVPNPPMF